MARKGLPAKYIKKYGVSKRAWREYRRARARGYVSGRRRTRPSVSSRTRTRRKGGRNVARRRRYTKKRRTRRSKAIPIATTLGLVGTTLAHGEYSLWRGIEHAIQTGDWQVPLKWAVLNYTGINPETGEFIPTYPITTWTPAIVGAIISKAVGGWPLNLNRKIPPQIRRYIKI